MASKTDKLIAKLQEGHKLTTAQIMRQCGFSSPNSVYGTVSRLRGEGYRIKSSLSSVGTTQYAMSSR